jgi:hypothetical protein
MVPLAERVHREWSDIARPLPSPCLSPGLVTFDLRKFPRDDAARFRGSLLDGKGTAMPAFRGRLGDEEVDLLWAYVRGGP